MLYGNLVRRRHLGSNRHHSGSQTAPMRERLTVTKVGRNLYLRCLESEVNSNLS